MAGYLPVKLRNKFMLLFGESLVKFICTHRFGVDLKASFAQTGEDLIVYYILQTLGIAKPSYLDIGAFHPYTISNTALLYQKGYRGVNIEPNPSLFPAFVKARPDDVNLNIGIADRAGELDYYAMSIPTLNTFSSEIAEQLLKEGFTIAKKSKLAVRTITDVVNSHCNGIFPDFLSIDVEGLELPILKSIEFEKGAPKVICVETVRFKRNHIGIKEGESIDFLVSKGYRNFADTHYNTIFVSNDLLQTGLGQNNG